MFNISNVVKRKTGLVSGLYGTEFQSSGTMRIKAFSSIGFYFVHVVGVSVLSSTSRLFFSFAGGNVYSG